MPKGKQKLIVKVCLGGGELFEAVRRMAWLKAKKRSGRAREVLKQKETRTNTRIELVTHGTPKLRNMEALVEIYEVPSKKDGDSA